MSEPTPDYPPLPSRIGERGTAERPLGGHYDWEVIDQILRIQSNRPNKLLVFEKFRMEEDGHVQFRFGYYKIGVKEGRKGKWVWGQYAPMIPVEDFKYIVEEAEKKGLVLRAISWT
jgi:hypothetical protein